jgi:methylenetetrahydrofolate--tRNA-(uracil-5-)-methyltransferase
MQPVHVIGGGLAGSEAAWQIAGRGTSVILHEMRPAQMTAAHKTDGLAELVCSNSFRSDDRDHNAVGLLHEEMRRLGSLVMRAGDANQVPAGGALAVDRDGFSQAITAALMSHPLIAISRGEVAGLPPPEWDSVIVATGPLTSPALAEAIRAATGENALAFFDAIAPIVHSDSIDMSIAWFQSRYDDSGPGGTGADYINCPLDRAQYDAFVDALLTADKMSFHDWEGTPYFDGCLPIEVMAERGHDTLRFGPMKPVGLTDQHQPHVKPHAVVQLRQDNRLGTLFNMVGFQTKLKHAEQTRVLRMIPGLAEAEFARLGGLHRNTFLNSPKLLDPLLRLKAMPRLRFAGQITGCEGYVESAAIGLMAGRFAAAERRGETVSVPPPTTAHGALIAHITGGHVETIDAGPRSFQPMNVNFGLFPPLADSPSRGADGTRLRGTAKAMAKRRALTARALADLDAWRDVGNHPPLQGEGRIAKGDPGWGEAAFVAPLSPPPPPGGGVRHSPPLRDGLALRGSGSNGDLVEPRPK